MIEMFYCFVAHNEAKVFSFFLLRGRLEKGTINEHSSNLAVIKVAKMKIYTLSYFFEISVLVANF